MTYVTLLLAHTECVHVLFIIFIHFHFYSHIYICFLFCHLCVLILQEMGLGKTIQTLAVMSAWQHKTGLSSKPSLVVCPVTIMHHWVAEASSKFPLLHPVLYDGPPATRAAALQTRVRDKHTILIVSYETLRRDADALAATPFAFVILDEGHRIKDPQAAVTKAVKSLVSDHRALLSGTPLQNDVLELWSLFDFLMPGYLGSEREFKAKYVRPVLATKDLPLHYVFASSADGAGLGSLDTNPVSRLGRARLQELKELVQPFCLRRLKDEVLVELPSKTIQVWHSNTSLLNPTYSLRRRVLYQFSLRNRCLIFNYVFECCIIGLFLSLSLFTFMQDVLCPLTGLQQRLCSIVEAVSTLPSSGVSPAQTRTCLKQAITHAAAIQVDMQVISAALSEHSAYSGKSPDAFGPIDTEYKALQTEIAAAVAGNNYGALSSKFSTLLDLLMETGATLAPSTSTSVETGLIRGKVIIFAQSKKTLDLLEDFLTCALASAAGTAGTAGRASSSSSSTSTSAPARSSEYIARIDGDVDVSVRSGIIERFQKQVLPRILLASTRVAGFGLTLTAAQTVFFVEYDPNPMVDMQVHYSYILPTISGSCTCMFYHPCICKSF